MADGINERRSRGGILIDSTTGDEPSIARENATCRLMLPDLERVPRESFRSAIMRSNWDQIIKQHWEMYDPYNNGRRLRPPGTTEKAIRDVERMIGFEFPAEFHDFYLTANGLGLDKYDLLPIDQIPRFTDESSSWLRESHPEIARRFYPFIDNEAGPVGYFVDSDGELMRYMILMARDRYYDDPRFDPEAFMEPSAQSIWEYLIC